MDNSKKMQKVYGLIDALKENKTISKTKRKQEMMKLSKRLINIAFFNKDVVNVNIQKIRKDAKRNNNYTLDLYMFLKQPFHCIF